MKFRPLLIQKIGSISALGQSEEGILSAYYKDKNNSNISFKKNRPQGAISQNSEKYLKNVIEKKFSESKDMDRVVLMALSCMSQYYKVEKSNKVLFCIGSSRGSTEVWEKQHSNFISNPKSIDIRTSPYTTLGNISSTLSKYFGEKENMGIDLSMTCSSGQLALLNGISWIQSGMADSAIVGGSEAPLTDFTFGQLDKMNLYSTIKEKNPCLALDTKKTKNTMVLGEGAAIFKLSDMKFAKKKEVQILGYGFYREELLSPTSVDNSGKGFYESMKMALKISNTNDLSEIDTIIAHCPGTIKGDKAEITAIVDLFGKEKSPNITNNKWKIGHTYGASGSLSIEMAMVMIQEGKFIPCPFYENNKNEDISPKKVLVNTAGFGGVFCSILLSEI